MNTLNTLTAALTLNLLTLGAAYANAADDEYSMEVLAPTASSFTTETSDEQTYASDYSIELVLPTTHVVTEATDERTYAEDYAMELDLPVQSDRVLANNSAL
ncbi:MAG TPA: hypothetical protein EYG50_10280 [Cycloclasticus sp.]|jgi:hypothetical protein|nr:hypothetical protein [Cycloclasticus sp.]HIL93104.1 hypothetical protein [Cycloclasticus sp.]